ncbi:uncharacterized protein LOC100124271 isoform X2 [Nasonia vitripennis]|uniref:Sterile alpha motif domain-containing protein 5 n=1 Tax=Nasonia vitripennis TaxID=7425 RepID=A0A7M7IW45_NASVI|nr:uncharacterized protein LOC100124271 isoform X2 [Nasonia vitripennis]
MSEPPEENVSPSPSAWKMSIASNIVVEWLHSLHLGEYAESFLDNGYDDLEICKQISEPDLDAIGVFKQSHRLRLLQSVKRLREEGAASVYFSLEESSACLCSASQQDCSSQELLSAAPTPDKEEQAAPKPPTKFIDEYEEGKAELVRIPRMQLRLLLQDKLRTDGIRLACQPYTTPEGERGYLEGLASRYADLLRTHYGDVLEPLEELRRRETDANLRMTSTQLTTSHSQPIYVPGKYSPSSCLSDKEEDEIYGFGYGVFGRQMMQQRQQKLALATQHLTLANHSMQQQQQQQQSLYQSCLSPRSAFFYEFPPNEQGQNTSKKKTTFSRILRGLKTVRKDKHNQAQSSPRHNTPRSGVPQRVDTPDSVLQSGLGLTPDTGHTVLRSMVDPRDYDRLKYLQANGSQANTFEETIHRLKVQEALRKKERFNKEHEDILKDIRQGLMLLGREDKSQYPDDTYMYDEEARCGDMHTLEVVGGGIQHWYDEPPYESDPEDFLMVCNTGEAGADGGSNARIENGRLCYRMNVEPDNRKESVISLRTAGDISLPKDRSRKLSSSTMRGLIVPQGLNNPPTIIPLTHSRTSRESGEYASSDVQSRSSGEEDENEESPRSQSTDYEDPDPTEEEANKAWRAQQYTAPPPLDRNCGSTRICAPAPTVAVGVAAGSGAGIAATSAVRARVGLGEGAAAVGIAGRARTLRQDVQRKINRLRQQRGSISEAGFPCSASSLESLPSGSASSSTQALVRAGSNHSSISCEEREPGSPQTSNITPNALGAVNVLCRARALVDCMPSPYDKDALAFKKGDIIDVLQMNNTGLWKGMVHNRLGHFKFINVEIINERFPRRGKWSQKYKQKPGSVPELLQRMNLQEYISVFLLNGYEDLELFRELEPADLDYLRIQHPEHRAKILTAVQLLHDLQSESDVDELAASSSENDEMAALGFNISRLGIGRKQSQRSENNLDAEPADSQPTEFQANLPLRLATNSTITRISTSVDH